MRRNRQRIRERDPSLAQVQFRSAGRAYRIEGDTLLELAKFPRMDPPFAWDGRIFAKVRGVLNELVGAR